MLMKKLYHKSIYPIIAAYVLSNMTSTTANADIPLNDLTKQPQLNERKINERFRVNSRINELLGNYGDITVPMEEGKKLPLDLNKITGLDGVVYDIGSALFEPDVTIDGKTMFDSTLHKGTKYSTRVDFYDKDEYEKLLEGKKGKAHMGYFNLKFKTKDVSKNIHQ